MKKYFLQETAEELEFGDMIVLDLSHDMENGHTKHHHLECKFMPELVPILLEEDIIEEKEVEEEKPLDFQDDDTPYPLMEEVIKANEELELRVDKLEKTVIKLREMVASLTVKSAYENARKQNRK
uniref:Intermediate conductance calcium-activated potassium channel-helix bundle, copper, MEMBRANE PROTEIN n=1 Tax=CrAss-like virus sp. ctjK323 TaxID=2825839 RepID=A0A8S5PZE8_9CAUD|nr:MAG TPA: Intermediate conductance calcium-activated potassium channel-helix bundle, copper, MEMBRANE PROTEIN [CrAss-like virus sp. ctjK323]